MAFKIDWLDEAATRAELVNERARYLEHAQKLKTWSFKRIDQATKKLKMAARRVDDGNHRAAKQKLEEAFMLLFEVAVEQGRTDEGLEQMRGLQASLERKD